MSYDGNGSSGLLSIDPSVASMSRVGGGSISGINLGSATDFSVASIITIASSTGGPTFASFDFIDIDVSQVIPAGSQGGMYSIELQLTSI